ncbi:MAG: hypothetical protein ACNS60_13745 [Candidatus Cyclobacteriaceae bacterium M2_1C_046]
MNRNSFVLTLIFVLISWLSFGQQYTFRVMVNKGSNEVKKGGEWMPLKTGAYLNDEDELKVTDDAYLGLVHSSGKTLELKDAGTHKISNLASNMNTGSSSVASKYADFVLSKMSAEGKKNRLSATGAVSRGTEGDIKIFMPNSAGVYTNDPILKWSEVEGENVDYTVTVTNMFEDVLMTANTSDPEYQLDLENENISDQKVVLITVSAGNDNAKSSTYAIKKLPTEDSQKIKSKLDELMNEVDQPTALNKYILAGFYEENNLLIDALTSYVEAMRMAPDVETYNEAYEEFLLRNRLKNN